jgi:hypothetical protein
MLFGDFPQEFGRTARILHRLPQRLLHLARHFGFSADIFRRRPGVLGAYTRAFSGCPYLLGLPAKLLGGNTQFFSDLPLFLGLLPIQLAVDPPDVGRLASRRYGALLRSSGVMLSLCHLRLRSAPSVADTRRGRPLAAH